MSIRWRIKNVMRRGRPQKTSRSAWIQAAVELLGEDGIDGVSVEALARQLGVTKGGFYGHFEDRAALLNAILEAWEKTGTQSIIDSVDAIHGKHGDRTEALWDRATRDGIAPELAIRDWARRDDDARAVVERVDRRRMAYLRQLFGELGFEGVDLEARCLLFYSLLIGDHFIVADHRRLSRKRVLARSRELLRC